VFYSIVIGANVAGGDTTALTSILDSSITSSSPKKKTPDDSIPRQELHLTLTKNNEVVFPTSDSVLTCTGKNSRAMQRLLEIITPFPQRPVKIGDSWSDTLSTTICHGKTPLVQQTVRQYHILDFIQREGRDLVKVQRNTTITLTSLSNQAAANLTASGSGSSISTLYLNRQSGALLDSDSQSQLQLTITTSRGAFPFTQMTTTHITAH
jgi:hypothetical protein